VDSYILSQQHIHARTLLAHTLPYRQLAFSKV
jgi:hypothetical protein